MFIMYVIIQYKYAYALSTPCDSHLSITPISPIYIMSLSINYESLKYNLKLYVTLVVNSGYNPTNRTYM